MLCSRIRRGLAILMVAACAMNIACTAKSPEARYEQRMKRLTKKLDKLTERMQREQQEEMDRRRQALQDSARQ